MWKTVKILLYVHLTETVVSCLFGKFNKTRKGRFQTFFTVLWQQWFLNKHRKKFSTPVFWVYSVNENAHFFSYSTFYFLSLFAANLIRLLYSNSTAVIKLIWKKRCLNQIKQIKEYLISHGWLLFVRLRKPWASQEKQLFSHTYRLLLHCSGTNEVPNSLPLHKDNCERVSKSLFASFSMACGERNGNATVNKNRKRQNNCLNEDIVLMWVTPSQMRKIHFLLFWTFSSLLNKEAWILLLLLGVQMKSNQKMALKEPVMFYLRPTGQGAVKIMNSWFGCASITTCIFRTFSLCRFNSPCELKLWFSSWSPFQIHTAPFWCFGLP